MSKAYRLHNFAIFPHARIGIDVASWQINNYDPIASVFDRAFGDDFADAVFRSLRDVLAIHFRSTLKIRHLDLCCGTGTLLSRLKKIRNTEAVGIDLSQGVVEVAKEKARQAGQHIAFCVGDVLEVEFPCKCNLVTMTLDALNHIRSVAGWKKLFIKIRSHLEPGGVFLFDINSPRRLLSDWSFPEVIVKPALTYVQCAFPPVITGEIVKRRILMQIFDSQAETAIKHSTLIEQISVPRPKLLDMLRSSGFSHVKHWNFLSKRPEENIFLKNRWFFLAY